MVTPQPQVSTVPVPTTASPAAWSDSRKSWSGLFEATAVTPLSSSGVTGLPNGLGTQQSTRPQSPTRQTRVSLGEESMLLLAPMNGDHDLPEIVLTWRSLQPVRPTCPRGLTNYGNMCFLNAVYQLWTSSACSHFIVLPLSYLDPAKPTSLSTPDQYVFQAEGAPRAGLAGESAIFASHEYSLC